MLKGKQSVWSNANGVRTPISELSHQHLSNIHWYYKVFNDTTNAHISYEISKRFKGRILCWEPLPVAGELLDLTRKGLITKRGDIVFQGSTIGMITHIENWQAWTK